MNTCYNYALRLLSKRDYSHFKMRKKLLEKEPEEEIVENVINELLEKKYLREDYYIEAFVKGHMRKGYSPYYIQQKLQLEQCQCDLIHIHSIFKEYGYTKERQIEELIYKKCKKASAYELDYKEKAKVLRFLSSKGHTMEEGQHILDNL